jgi:hypothetical protein
MSPRLVTAAFLLSLSVSAMAQEAGTTEVSRPLNLSLPRDAAWSSPVRPERATSDGLQGNAMGLPDMGAGSTTGRAGRMPYGTGYEARQRNRTESGFGNSSEVGRGHGGGRMGRGR